MSNQQKDAKSRALEIGVPEFDPSYLKADTQSQFKNMNDKDKADLIAMWYEKQIPHYEQHFYQKKLSELQTKAFPLGVP